MKKPMTFVLGIVIGSVTVTGIVRLSSAQSGTQSVQTQTTNTQQPRPTPPMPPGPNPNSQYRLGPDSLPQEGVPKGEIRGPFTLPSNAYPGTQHTYWVYVPAQYDPA